MATAGAGGGDKDDVRKASRVHHAARRRGSSMAGRGEGAAAGTDEAHRRADGGARERRGISSLSRRFPGRPPGTGMGGGPQHPDRYSLGGLRRAVDAAKRKGTHCAAARPDCFAKRTYHGGIKATNQHRPDRLRKRCRSGGQRLRRELPATGWQRHWFILMEPTMAGKWLELLKEIAPRVNRVVLLFNPATAP